ncbi:urease accessory protein UreH domain-containing protein [Brotaphodocola sp.]|uniref:urease accessory protein UreH domain-containing protein n=1 Tax=Brotaphodocola sp. TaxID=3073577 RepID=UPI003D7E85D4
MCEKSAVKKRFYIAGMTCINCQNKIEYKLKNTAGIHEAKVCYANSYADVVYDSDVIRPKDIQRIIEELGYEIEAQAEGDRRQKIGTTPANAKRMIVLLLAVISLYVLLQTSGILNLLVPSYLADTKMGYGMMFVIGLLTSVHCIAMCGGINLSQCLSVSGDQVDETCKKKTKTRISQPVILYNAGRVVSYTAIGFLLGLIGMGLSGNGNSGMGISVALQGMLKIIAGIFMVIMGINMLGIFPWLRRWNLHMPNGFARKIHAQKQKNRQPFVIGLLNGLMPCGPLQSMQIVALASGNPFAGAFAMFLFSLGTVPLMLGLGFLASALSKKFAEKAMTVGAVLVAVLGLAMMAQGGALSGLFSADQLLVIFSALGVLGVIFEMRTCLSETAGKREKRENVLPVVMGMIALVIVMVGMIGMQTATGNAGEWRLGGTNGIETDQRSQIVQTDGTEKRDTTANIDGTDKIDRTGETTDPSEKTSSPTSEPQVIRSTLSARRYPNITVQAGVPVKWIIEAPKGSINGCNYKMLIREYGVEHTFSEGENVIEFVPTKSGTVSYTCWMGMIRGNIFVTDQKNQEVENQSENAGKDQQKDQKKDPQEDTQIEGEGQENDQAEQNGKTGQIGQSDGQSANVPVSSGYQIPVEQLAVARRTKDETGQDIQEVAINLTKNGFSPAVIVVESDVPVKWKITNTLSEKETKEEKQLLVPNYSTKLDLFSGENLFYLYPQESFEVSTEDHQFYAYVKVVGDLSQIDEEAIRREVQEFDPLIYPEAVFESAGMSCCGGD